MFITLPNQVFFEPTEEFLDFFSKQYKGKPIIEVGAGTGRFSKLLHDKGLRVIAIDAFPRDNPESDVTIINSDMFPFQPNSVVVIARPSRGQWIQDTIDKAVDAGAIVVYIGIEKHYDDDIYSLTYPCEKVYSCAGNDEEEVFQIGEAMSNNTNNTNKKEYFLIEHGANTPFAMKYWVTDLGSKWGHANGVSWMPKSKDDIVHESSFVEDDNDLDWTKVNLLHDNEKESGWLSRSGEFFGCGYMEHDNIAYRILKKTIVELENSGWIRLHGVRTDDWMMAYSFNGRLSAEQRRWLTRVGYSVRDDD